LRAGFPAKNDPEGKAIAKLYADIGDLIANGRAAEADPLFLEAYRTLRDPDQRRPEWPWLLIRNADSLTSRGRKVDAFFCYEAAFAIASEALKPYLSLELAVNASDPKLKRDNLRKAYLAGGDALFHAAGAETELAEVLADGVATNEP
jgi:hypothetical protein